MTQRESSTQSIEASQQHFPCKTRDRQWKVVVGGRWTRMKIEGGGERKSWGGRGRTQTSQRPLKGWTAVEVRKRDVSWYESLVGFRISVFACVCAGMFACVFHLTRRHVCLCFTGPLPCLLVSLALSACLLVLFHCACGILCQAPDEKNSSAITPDTMSARSRTAVGSREHGRPRAVSEVFSADPSQQPFLLSLPGSVCGICCMLSCV